MSRYLWAYILFSFKLSPNSLASIHNSYLTYSFVYLLACPFIYVMLTQTCKFLFYSVHYELSLLFFVHTTQDLASPLPAASFSFWRVPIILWAFVCSPAQEYIPCPIYSIYSFTAPSLESAVSLEVLVPLMENDVWTPRPGYCKCSISVLLPMCLAFRPFWWTAIHTRKDICVCNLLIHKLASQL